MNRLTGLDTARFLAFAGMVVVNFNVAAHAKPDWSSSIIDIFQGRAAALFVVLAGVGISIANIKPGGLLLRGLVLFAIGLLNMLIFPADILHYYGVYFLFAALIIGLSGRILLGLAALVTLLAYIALFILDYEAGWDWVTLTYEGFWTPVGFIRNMFFNGWHPVFPWIAFLIFGMWLGRQDLANPKFQKQLMIWGAIGFSIILALSAGLGIIDPELTEVVALSPIPPNPFYISAGIATSSFVLGFCLRFLHSAQFAHLFGLAGRQTLTLYIAHILVGLVILDAMGWLAEERPAAHMLLAAIVFIALSILYSLLWQRISPYGPMEHIMRFLTQRTRS